MYVLQHERHMLQLWWHTWLPGQPENTDVNKRAAAEKHFISDSTSGLSVFHIKLGIGKWPQSAGFSFDALSIINPNIISRALFPPTHLQKECLIENNNNCITSPLPPRPYSLPNGAGEKWRHAFKEAKPIISI